MIELLGVIVILAIIALIATPIILNIIDKSKQSSNKISIDHIIDTANLYYTNNIFNKTNDEETIFYCNRINCTTGDNELLEFGGNVPEGKIAIDKDGNVSLILELGSSCFKKEYSSSNITENKNTDSCDHIDVNSYIKQGLILHYDGINNTRKGNNPSNTIWEDLSGNNNNGKMINTNNSILYKEKGYEFTNNSDYIESIKSLGLNSDPSITIEFVGKFYGLQSGQTHASLFTVGSTAAINGQSFTGFLTSLISFGTVNSSIKTPNNLETQKVFSITYKKSEGTFGLDNADIYINGEEQSVQEGSKSSMNYVDTSIQIGRGWQWQNQNRTFNGIIYSVRIYDRVLTEDEIQYNYLVDQHRYFNN